jgi:hypothetical protein
MAISEVFVPGIYPRTLRAEYRVEGDNPWAAYTTREAAEKREAELAAEKSKTD